MHAREQIRAAFVTALAAVPALSGRVLDAVADRRSTKAGPVAVVFTRREASRRRTQGRPEYLLERTTEVAVSIALEAGGFAALATAADDLAVAVEVALATDAPLRALTHEVVLQRTDFDPVDEAERPTGRLTLTYEVTVSTSSIDPETLT